ncbi:MAG: hypothetical protein PHS33_08630 [Candidatus Omnitrophica bacterium]|nr:hypothetical protein [Candidatus Omnitrophota bacterium]
MNEYFKQQWRKAIESQPFWESVHRRYDPVSITLIAVAATAGGIAAYSSYQQGKEEEELAKQRAAIDQENALMAEQEAADQARIEEEKGQKLLSRQKVMWAASGVRSNVGAPLVVEAETMRDISVEKGFILKRGQNIARNYRMQAAYETAYGKSAKRQSRWAAMSTLMGTGAQMGSQMQSAGMFSGTQKTGGVGSIGGTGFSGSKTYRSDTGYNFGNIWKS